MALMVALGVTTACKKEVVGNQGEPVQEPNAALAVTLVEAKAQRIEIEGQKGPLVYKDPVLAIKLKFENTGQQDFNYTPTHKLNKASNLEAPLLFVDPGPEGELRNNIAGVFLEEGLVPGQQDKDTAIAAGAALEDVYLYTLPEGESANLILTVPPSMHGGQGLLKIKMAYQAAALPGPTVHNQGEAINVGSATLTITGSKIEYLKLNDSNKGKGYSKDPVLKVSFTIKNNGDKPITYEPGHRLSGQGMAMTLVEDGGSGRYMRALFGADREVPGQVAVRSTVDAGKEKKDFAVFERPPENVKALQLHIPGRLFGQEGLVRVKVPYTYKNPKKPGDFPGK